MKLIYIAMMDIYIYIERENILYTYSIVSFMCIQHNIYFIKNIYIYIYIYNMKWIL